ARLGHRIFDRGERRRLADRAQPVDGRARAESGAAERDRGDTQKHRTFRHDTHSLRGGSAAGWDGAAEPCAAARGMIAAMVTSPAPETVPCRVRFDCRFSTLMASPWAPDSKALPRIVSTSPGAWYTSVTASLRWTSSGFIRSPGRNGSPAASGR